ncbi:unnamed protein product [Trichogramma brassicae]|uniref:Uncharacterized protein n=1 Tax=Trichogramma brassicae TaxID=86971 RepID=A0A6H5IKH5_9HYME|nr:unnamed protein product [Trichogramma brassicae]
MTHATVAGEDDGAAASPEAVVGARRFTFHSRMRKTCGKSSPSSRAASTRSTVDRSHGCSWAGMPDKRTSQSSKQPVEERRPRHAADSPRRRSSGETCDLLADLHERLSVLGMPLLNLPQFTGQALVEFSDMCSVGGNCDVLVVLPLGECIQAFVDVVEASIHTLIKFSGEPFQRALCRLLDGRHDF